MELGNSFNPRVCGYPDSEIRRLCPAQSNRKHKLFQKKVSLPYPGSWPGATLSDSWDKRSQWSKRSRHQKYLRFCPYRYVTRTALSRLAALRLVDAGTRAWRRSGASSQPQGLLSRRASVRAYNNL